MSSVVQLFCIFFLTESCLFISLFTCMKTKNKKKKYTRKKCTGCMINYLRFMEAVKNRNDHFVIKRKQLTLQKIPAPLKLQHVCNVIITIYISKQNLWTI